MSLQDFIERVYTRVMLLLLHCFGYLLLAIFVRFYAFQNKYTFQISINKSSEELIRISLDKKSKTTGEAMSDPAKYVLRVCGYQEYLLGNYPLSQFMVRVRLLYRPISPISFSNFPIVSFAILSFLLLHELLFLRLTLNFVNFLKSSGFLDLLSEKCLLPASVLMIDFNGEFKYRG